VNLGFDAGKLLFSVPAGLNVCSR